MVQARKDLSLRWLELFQICAREGSLQAAADESGLTLSTVSHHLRSLEAHLGVDLFDHSRRPMVLTPRGQAFLRNIEGALLDIRKATSEAAAGDGTEARFLRIGTVEDFDSDIAPALAVRLAQAMPRCDFLYHTDASHMIHAMLQRRELDLGVASVAPERDGALRERVLLRDPYVLVLPAGIESEGLLQGASELPFLRFSSGLLIARQIEAQLRRMRVVLPPRFECANTQTLLAMVAAGAGWTIMTPLLFSRARGGAQDLVIAPFPGKGFARRLALLSTPDCSGATVDFVEAALRELLMRHAVAPMLEAQPWLEGAFGLEAGG